MVVEVARAKQAVGLRDQIAVGLQLHLAGFQLPGASATRFKGDRALCTAAVNTTRRTWRPAKTGESTKVSSETGP